MFGFKSRRRLLLENAVMRAALLWYAAKETWRRKGIHQKGAPRKKWQKSPAAYDRGHGAIRALTLIDEKRVGKWSVTVPAPLPLPPAPIDSNILGSAEATATDTD
jgi:hypothetical protein